mmetsp:Transcript_90917/g.190103  ORF Transcript_90917/g.190103 Transcript_90917/m.190103 type:complete len:497 (-) Transcript_90917:185-1675(-)
MFTATKSWLLQRKRRKLRSSSSSWASATMVMLLATLGLLASLQGVSGDYCQAYDSSDTSGWCEYMETGADCCSGCDSCSSSSCTDYYCVWYVEGSSTTEESSDSDSTGEIVAVSATVLILLPAMVGCIYRRCRRRAKATSVSAPTLPVSVPGSTVSPLSSPTPVSIGSGSPASGGKTSEVVQSTPLTVQVQCGACRATVTVGMSVAGVARYTCPSCGTINEFCIGGAAKDDVIHDTHVKVELPQYWQMASMTAPPGGLQMESEEVKRAMQIFLDKTWKNQWTRDRGKDGKVMKFEVVMVHRNENPAIWEPYYRTRHRIAELVKKDSANFTPYPMKTTTAVKGYSEADDFLQRAELMEDVNEFYLCHGTKPSAAKAICDNDFLVKMAGANAGTLYGPGIYFAEASSKSDEYAQEDTDGIFAGLYALLVCRVCAGKMNYSDEVRPPVQSLVDSIVKDGTHHSVLGDREKCRGTYREIIVFDKDQAYPEYVVIYRRVPA